MPINQFIAVQPAGASPNTREFTEAQRRLERIINAVIKKPFMDGIFLQGLALEFGYENHVEHGLGRAYVSYCVCKQGAAAAVYCPSTSTADAALYVPLVATAAVTVDLVVF